MIFYRIKILLNLFEYKNFKRFFDILFSIIIIFFFIPIYLICISSIFLTMGRPIFFIQERGGLNNKVFKLIKFRTMTLEINENNKLLDDKLRITKLGKILRETSLDEIPSLINVLKGEMSFVGPRPFLAKYLKLYTNEQKKRHQLRPGITGWAQISGRNLISWEKKFEFDLWYVNNVNFFLDIKIIILTFFTVFKKEGMNQSDQYTMSEFKGKD